MRTSRDSLPQNGGRRGYVTLRSRDGVRLRKRWSARRTWRDGKTTRAHTWGRACWRPGDQSVSNRVNRNRATLKLREFTVAKSRLRARTISGSNCLADIRLISLTAADVERADLYGRSETIASKESATRTMRAANGILDFRVGAGDGAGTQGFQAVLTGVEDTPPLRRLCFRCICNRQ
jgi:hypothetical protein